MTPQQRDVLRQFRKRRIRFLVVGGTAMQSYGISRETHDLDLWVARDSENAKALHKFAITLVSDIPPFEKFLKPNLKLFIGNLNRPDVDILTSVAGDPSFHECFMRSIKTTIAGESMRVICAQDLHKIKIANLERMELDQRDSTLSATDQENARRTARKERLDIMMLEAYLQN